MRAVCGHCGKRRDWTAMVDRFGMICSYCYVSQTPESEWTPAYAAYMSQVRSDALEAKAVELEAAGFTVIRPEEPA